MDYYTVVCKDRNSSEIFSMQVWSCGIMEAVRQAETDSAIKGKLITVISVNGKEI